MASKKAKVSLNDDEKELLINAVKTRPFLFDTGHDLYFDTKMKDLAWIEIGETMHLTGTDARKQFVALRRYYTELKRKLKGKSGQGASQAIKWPHYDSFQFLEQCDQPMPSLCSLSQNYEESAIAGASTELQIEHLLEESFDAEYLDDELLEMGTRNRNVNASNLNDIDKSTAIRTPEAFKICRPRSHKKNMCTPTPPQKKPRRSQFNDDVPVWIQTLTKYCGPTEPENDAESLFGRFVGASLKDIKNSAVKKRCQVEIHKLILEHVRMDDE